MNYKLQITFLFNLFRDYKLQITFQNFWVNYKLQITFEVYFGNTNTNYISWKIYEKLQVTSYSNSITNTKYDYISAEYRNYRNNEYDLLSTIQIHFSVYLMCSKIWCSFQWSTNPLALFVQTYSASNAFSNYLPILLQRNYFEIFPFQDNWKRWLVTIHFSSLSS